MTQDPRGQGAGGAQALPPAAPQPPTPPGDTTPLARLRELAEGATPGPWRVDAHVIPNVWSAGDGPVASTCHDYRVATRDANAAYIAAASPDVVLGLLSEIERLTGECDEWKSAAEDETARRHRLGEQVTALTADSVIGNAAWAHVVEAVRGISEDYMTSESHHPNDVLIPTHRFASLQRAEELIAALSARSALKGGGE